MEQSTFAIKQTRVRFRYHHALLFRHPAQQASPDVPWGALNASRDARKAEYNEVRAHRTMG
ncbi:hypothetical protein EAS62_36780 [Bradyrhizobium zhanjiangense]|uniref:Integrase n=1 Tax=Bradyrhizobium zhanjiangense TaxID=1325107 RepID=A0ABY0D9L1_9BRAD|nr:hypothetical protein EAS62_36780 [Bradyrhizobium zhanjiangense]